MAAARPKHQKMNEILTRPGNMFSKCGTGGKKVVLKANYFKLTSKTDWCLYQYRVDIAPEEDRTVVRKALLRTHKDKLGAYLFDGTVLFTCNPLPQPLELNSIRNEDQHPMNIKVRLVGDLAKGDYQYLQFFNLLVRKCFEHLNLQLVGRNYYDASSKVAVPSFHLELWPGCITSIRQHESDIMMCAEISHKVMRDETLLTVLNDYYNRNKYQYQELYKKSVIGTVVLTAYNNRTYRINDVHFGVNPLTTFKKNGQNISYVEYYQQRYNCSITDLRQPLLISLAKARDRRAGQNELVYLIPELCRSTGLTDEMRNNFNLMKALAEHTRVSPSSRITKLLNFCRRLKSKPEINKEFSKWNFQLADNLIEIPGRIIPDETIFFGNRQTLISKDADWNFQLQDKPAYKTCELKSWIVLVPKKVVSEAKNFLKTMLEAAIKINFSISIPRIFELPNDHAETYVTHIDKITNEHNPQVVFCIVMNNQLQRYAAIKKKLCVDRPIPSQVVLARTLSQKKDTMLKAVCNKVAVQLNCKLGGIPWALNIGGLLPSLMVVGFDVCHNKNGTDFGAMVASLDTSTGRYFSAVSPHSSGEELSNDLSINLIKAIYEFRQIRNMLPNPIIIYRDGVGEGQIPFVHSHEINQIKKDLASIYKDIPVKLAFIIVTKRINTRIFLNNNNPPPGTVVDDVITDPLKFDFFIVSQNVKQGTVAPTSYNVIYNTTDLDVEKIQRVTFKFCHLYFNFSGTVRVPAPCQYAHKLAFFVSTTIKQNAHPNLKNLLYFL